MQPIEQDYFALNVSGESSLPSLRGVDANYPKDLRREERSGMHGKGGQL